MGGVKKIYEESELRKRLKEYLISIREGANKFLI